MAWKWEEINKKTFCENSLFHYFPNLFFLKFHQKIPALIILLTPSHILSLFLKFRKKWVLRGAHYLKGPYGLWKAKYSKWYKFCYIEPFKGHRNTLVSALPLKLIFFKNLKKIPKICEGLHKIINTGIFWWNLEKKKWKKRRN